VPNILSDFLGSVLSMASSLLLIEIVLIPTAFVIVVGFFVYMHKKKEERLKELAIKLEPEVMKLALKYGGVITKSIIVAELNTKLEVAEKSLKRFLNQGEALKITTADVVLYDFPSARNQMGESDRTIITALKENIKGLSRGLLLEKTDIKLDALQKTLNRLEKEGIIVYDELSDRYKLRSSEE
jgi:ribosomal protein S25